MHRIPVVLGVVLVAALALGACDAQFTPFAARVDGAAVSQSNLDAALDSVAIDPGYRCLVESASGGKTGVIGVVPGTYNAAFVADSLSLLIEAEAIHVVVSRRGLAEGALATQLARDQITTDLSPGSGSTCEVTGAQVFAGLAEPFRTSLVELRADEDALAAHAVGVELTSAGVAAYERHHRATTTLDCTWAIEIASEDKAAQLAVAIDHGVSFAEVARKDSLDAASADRGGDLGCILPATLRSPLGKDVERLSLGRLSSPIPFGKYWLLFRVTRRPVAPLSEAAAVAVGAGTAAAQKQLSAIVVAAHISVDPTFGSWAKVSGTWTVRPPSGPPVDLVPNPSAVMAGTDPAH